MVFKTAGRYNKMACVCQADGSVSIKILFSFFKVDKILPNKNIVVIFTCSCKNFLKDLLWYTVS